MGGVLFSPNLAKSVPTSSCKALLNMQSPTQAGNKHVGIWIGLSYYYFAAFPGARSKEGSCAPLQIEGHFPPWISRATFFFLFNYKELFSRNHFHLSVSRVRLEVLKWNPKFLENHCKIIFLIWSQEGKGKGIAEVCSNQAPKNQEILVEIAFPTGYYALRIGGGGGSQRKILKEAE